MRQWFTLLFVVLLFGMIAYASAADKETIVFTNRDSNGVEGAKANGLGTHKSPGDYSLGKVRIVGTLRKVHADTLAREVRIRIVSPRGRVKIVQPFTEGAFNELNVDMFVNVDKGRDPEGDWKFQFFETVDNGGITRVDARWTTITFTFTNELETPPAGTNLGLLPQGVTTREVNVGPGEIKWFLFTLDGAADAAKYLDIDTETTTAFLPGNDTKIALYLGKGGTKVAEDDDSGSDELSQLTFGAPSGARPKVGNGLAYNGRNGLVNYGGIYYLAIAGTGTTFEDDDWRATSTSTRAGTVKVRIKWDMQPFALQYVGRTNPTGIPDISQQGDAICGAAAASDAFWNWSNYVPFNDIEKPLFPHSDPANFAESWGFDSKTFMLKFADIIYGPVENKERKKGLGMIEGMLEMAKKAERAYNVRKLPNGLGVEAFVDNIPYSKIRDLVTQRSRNALLSIYWYDTRGNAQSDAHALCLAGIDDTRKILAVSHGWGNHATRNDEYPPVTPMYYDYYQLDPNNVANYNWPRLKRSGGGNELFVRRGDDANQTASYMDIYRVMELKSGPCPSVYGTLSASNSSQEVVFHVENPDEPAPMYHIYLSLSPGLDMSMLLSAARSWLFAHQPAWQVDLLDFNLHAEQRMFGITGRTDPETNGAQVIPATWRNGSIGLHYWTSSAPLVMGSTVEFGIQYPSVGPYPAWNGLYFTLNAAKNHLYGGAIGMSTGVTVAGHVDLESYLGNPLGMPTTIEFRRPGEASVLESHETYLDSGGDYSIETALPAGVYDIAAKSVHHLRSVRSGIPVAGPGAVGVDFFVLNGDCDGDNEVAVGDFARLSAAFMSVPGDDPWDSAADLSGDRRVDIADYAILSANFGQIGDA